MSAVRRTEFVEDVLNVNFHGSNRRTQAVADFFVSEALCDKFQHLYFPRSEGRLRQMIAEPSRNFALREALAGMYGANCAYDFSVSHLLEQVSPNAGLERAIDVLIAVVAG